MTPAREPGGEVCVTNFQSVSDGQLFPGIDWLGYFLLAHLVANPYPPGQGGGKKKKTRTINQNKTTRQRVTRFHSQDSFALEP